MNKITKTMTIGLTEDGQAGINISPDVNAAEAFQLVGTLALHVLNAYYKVASANLNINLNSGSTPKNQKLSKADTTAALTGIKESMYDAMDNIFSTVLVQFYPEAPRSSLEEEAILQLTNELIEKRYNELTPEQQKAFSKHYQATLAQLQTKIQSKQSEQQKSGDLTNEDPVNTDTTN